MIIDKLDTIILYYADLKDEFKTHRSAEITSFTQFNGVTAEHIYRAHIVLYIDYYSNTCILKNRYGRPELLYTDFIGNKLEIGDRVAYIVKSYERLKFGYIIGFTPKGIRIGDSVDQVNSPTVVLQRYIVKI